LLCKLLAATGVAGKPASYFHNPSIVDWLKSFDLPPESTGTLRDVLGSIFDAARARGAAKTGLFGLRLQRKSFDFVIRQMDVLHPDLPNDRTRFKAAFGCTLFIHLTRRNKLDQAISYVKATQSGLWHIAPDGTEIERISAPKEPVYDASEIAHHLAALTALDSDWEDWFARENIRPLRITYDALAADPAAILAQILDQLGLDPAAAMGATPAVARLADATNRNWADRFRAEIGDICAG
jgi:LPS sulfotransferase NodH